jgi:hypothetical protein
LGSCSTHWSRMRAGSACRSLRGDLLRDHHDVWRRLRHIPAYLSDIFGTQFVGAIHGRLLTAWSTAGVVGPLLVNEIRQHQVDRGVPVAEAYNTTMYVLAGLLVIGFICNLLVRPLPDRYFMSDEELARERLRGH